MVTTMAAAQRAKGYDDDGNNDGGRNDGDRATKSTMMATARRVTTMGSGATGYDKDDDGDE
jgi:hypothetical protein